MRITRIALAMTLAAMSVGLTTAPASAVTVNQTQFTTELRAALTAWAAQQGANERATTEIYNSKGKLTDKGTIAVNGDGSAIITGTGHKKSPTLCVSSTQCWVFNQASGLWYAKGTPPRINHTAGVDAYVSAIERAPSTPLRTFSIDGTTYGWKDRDKEGAVTFTATITVNDDTVAITYKSTKQTLKVTFDIDTPVTPVKAPPANLIAK